MVLIIQPIRYVIRRKRIGSFGNIKRREERKKGREFSTKRVRRSSNRKAKNQRLAPSEVERQQAWVIRVKRFH